MTQVYFYLGLLVLLATIGTATWFGRFHIAAWRARRSQERLERRLTRRALRECRSLCRCTRERTEADHCREAMLLVESAELYMDFVQRKHPSVASCGCSGRGFIGIAMSELARAGKILDGHEQSPGIALKIAA